MAATPEEIKVFKAKEDTTTSSFYTDKFNLETNSALLGSKNDGKGLQAISSAIIQMLQILCSKTMFQIVEIGSGTGVASKKIIYNFSQDITKHVSRWIATDLCHKPDLVARDLSKNLIYQTELSQLTTNAKDAFVKYKIAKYDLLKLEEDVKETNLSLEKSKSNLSTSKNDLNTIELLLAKQTFDIKKGKENIDSLLKIYKASLKTLDGYKISFIDNLEPNVVPSYFPVSIAQMSCSSVLEKIKGDKAPTIIFIACPTPYEDGISHDIYTLVQSYYIKNISYVIIIKNHDDRARHIDGTGDFYGRIKHLSKHNMWHLVYNKNIFSYQNDACSGGYITYTKRNILIFSRKRNDYDKLFNPDTGIKL